MESYGFTWYCIMRCLCTLATACTLYMLMKWLTIRHRTERKGNGVALWFQTPPHPISLTGSSNCLDIYGMQESNDEADG